ncbi:MAG TPA: ester cyclase [Ktedonobacterales bacterium]|nr:ester cyclase [Ktedonobacterales bacterium]
MGAQDNATAIQAFNDAFNARNVEAGVALCTPDVTLANVANGATFNGPDGVRQFFQGWTTAFPDGKVQNTAIVADDQRAVVEFIGRGTQTGPLVGPEMTVPATGKTAEIHFVGIAEMRQGKIAGMRLYFDAMGMLIQLGVVPAPAQVQARG